MFYNLFFRILLILAVIFTIFLCFTKPQMHTALMVYNSDYKIVNNQQTTTEHKTTSTTKKTAPIQTKKTQVEQTRTVQPKTVKNQPITTQKVEVKTPIKMQKVQNSVNTVSPVQQKVQTTVQKQPHVQTQTKTLEHEEIEWNKWRSNIQNKIMSDVKLPILPQGTIFKFSFDVDKYGRVTNVQTWSLTPTYTPYAVQYIAPVIRSYQGRSILDFPTGSNRINTTVTGQWKISNSQKYSTSSNFHDIETVRKGY